MTIMDKHPPNMAVSMFRGGRLALHLFYAVLLAVFYPRLKPAKRRRILKTWSRQLLDILNIGIRTEGQWPVRGEGGYLVVANHVSWLDVFVLNTIYPSRFIAKAEIRNWPLIGWLCKRSNTIFIERAMRQNAASINQQVSFLLKQGVCVGLFPEGTTTDGKQAGHFHSALIQPAIDAGAMLCPIALRYQDGDGKQSSTAVFTGDMTLSQSIWRILRSPRFDALLVFTLRWRLPVRTAGYWRAPHKMPFHKGCKIWPPCGECRSKRQHPPFPKRCSRRNPLMRRSFSRFLASRPSSNFTNSSYSRHRTATRIQ